MITHPFLSVGRSTALMLTLFAAALEPAINAATEPDILRYAITQGGLLLVVIVLLAYIRKLHRDEMDARDHVIEDKDEKLQAMINLATEVKVALSESLKVTASQGESIQSLSRTVQSINERKNPR